MTFQQTTNRSWTDSNGNRAVDCVLTSKVAEDNRPHGGDICGAWTNLNFGNPFSTTTVNPDVLHGWGIRPYDWQFGVSIQQEIVPRVSVDVSYNRRWWGNSLLHRQPGDRAAGFRHGDDHRAEQCEPAERRRLSGDLRARATPVRRSARRTTTTRSPATTATSRRTGMAWTCRSTRARETASRSRAARAPVAAFGTTAR